MHAPGQPARVDRAEFRDTVQAGEIERGGILDDQQDVLVEAPLGGFNGEPELQRGGGHARVGVEAVGGLGLAGVTIHRLGNRGRGMFDGVHKNRGESTFKTFIGQVSRQSRSMGPNSMG